MRYMATTYGNATSVTNVNFGNDESATALTRSFDVILKRVDDIFLELSATRPSDQGQNDPANRKILIKELEVILDFAETIVDRLEQHLLSTEP
jgi:hypothetical protein